MSVEILIGLVSFLVFIFLQALCINGLHTCFNGGVVNDIKKGKIYSGMVFYMLAPKFFEENKQKIWAKPLYSCVKCMASFWSVVTFWPLVICLFGFHLSEIPVWIFDAMCLVPLNYFIYQKI